MYVQQKISGDEHLGELHYETEQGLAPPKPPQRKASTFPAEHCALMYRLPLMLELCAHVSSQLHA